MKTKYGGKDDKEIDSDVQFIKRKVAIIFTSLTHDPEEMLYVIAESELWLEKVMP
jgi:vacuolar protein sorting-associated protein 3